MYMNESGEPSFLKHFKLAVAASLLALISPIASASPVSSVSLYPALAETAQDWRELLDQLTSADGVMRARAERKCQGGGSELAAVAIEAFETADLSARREWARIIRREASLESLPEVLRLLSDADSGVRRQLARFLARPDHAAHEIDARVLALEGIVRTDADLALRRGSILLLGEIDEDAALEVLARLLVDLPIDERVVAARALPESKRARALVRDLVVKGFDAPPGERTPPRILAVLLPLHGRLLADDPTGGSNARDCAPLVLGIDHPHPSVRAGAGRGFERLLSRLRNLGEYGRASRVLEALGEFGLDRRLVHYHRARLAFYPGADPAAALLAGRAIREEPPAGSADDGIYQDSLWRFRSFHLEALALWGTGKPEQALPLFESAGSVLDTLLSERYDLSPDDISQLRHVDALQHRALVAISSACCSIAAGTDPRKVLPIARLAHVLSLESQVGYAAVRGDGNRGWDSLLESELSPFRLLFTELDWPELPMPRRLELQASMGRLLASVATTEMPGFAPLENLAPEMMDPLADPSRRILLQQVQKNRVDMLDEDIGTVQRRMLSKQAADPGRIPDEERQEITLLLRARGRILRAMEQWEATGYKELLELRNPSSLALWLSRDLRSEGRAVDSRRYAERMRDDLEESAFFRNYYWGLERLAQIEMAIGNSYTDEDEPERAEEELEKAVERLRGIEERLIELGAARANVEVIRGIRSAALVGLAVNANVKLGDAEKALQYYERAYKLRKDDFMQVLLACYRARSGRIPEARVLLRELRPRPQLYYNLACTHALLGDVERALDYLERELEENQSSEAARQRQMDWAREDPDLRNLREDPRFERLVGPGQ
ncbi:MAG: tetratricopeptide (TPR) repeat protein [Planctomycetota bacterium]|jgi:tetratricopeptide (TPR) repeat protein